MPETAMRSGHMTAAFFTPSASAMAFMASSMASSFHSQPSSAVRQSSRKCFELSSVLLLFLLTKSSAPYSGSSSKKPSLPGMSVSTSVRCWSSAAMAAGSMSGFFTAWRIYGSATCAKSSLLIARMYSALNQRSFSMSNMAGLLLRPLVSNISSSSWSE